MQQNCPNCGSSKVKKNGHVKSTGKQNNYCNNCGRNFCDDADKEIVSYEKQCMIRSAFTEKISLRGICRVFSVSMTWLQGFFKKEASLLPDDLCFDLDLAFKVNYGEDFDPSRKHRLSIFCEADELCTFVGKKKNKKWVWIALDFETKQIIAFHVGDRSKKSCRKLWRKIPVEYRMHTFVFTDHLKSYKCVIPESKHDDVDKGTGLTSLIEAFNNKLRQRLARLGRKACSFSKSTENLIRSIHMFIVEHNLDIQLKFE